MAGAESLPPLSARSQVVGARRELQQRWYDEGWYSGATMRDALRVGAGRWPELELVFETTRGRQALTLHDTLARAERVAAGMHRMGIRPGDVVAVQLPNWAETAVVYAGSARRCCRSCTSTGRPRPVSSSIARTRGCS
jgi:non-ribosomal peptide synthetase component E (peptide arylation enzyme)